MAVLAFPLLFLLSLHPFIFVLLMAFLAFRKVVVLTCEDKSSVKIPPGRLGLPFFGETIQFLAANNSDKGIYDFVRIRRLRYGNCFKTRILGRTHVFISGTKSAKVVLGNEFGIFTKRYVRSMAELVGDQSLLCVSQEQHRLLRNRLSHLVSTESVALFINHFDQLVMNTLSNWEDRSVVIVLQDALQMTFIGMCNMLMSLEDPDELEMLKDDVTQICEAMLSFPSKLPFTRFNKGLQARKRVMDRLKKMVDMRRQGLGKGGDDFLQSLLDTENSPCKDTPIFSDTQIQENILTLIIAGQVTTASAMTWMVKYLDENQEIQETLRQQHISHKASPGQRLVLQDLNDMQNAFKIVKESLRLASIVSWFPRLALKDCEVQGFKIKKGWIVNIDAKAIHLDPTLYPEPTKFNPCRFENDLKSYSFLAFGTGSRTCLGMNLAKVMMVVFLHRLVTTYRWKVIDSDPNLEKRALFSRLRSGCPVRVMRLERH